MNGGFIGMLVGIACNAVSMGLYWGGYHLPLFLWALVLSLGTQFFVTNFIDG